MAKVRVVTAYVDLRLEKRPSVEFHKLGLRLVRACKPPVSVYSDFQLHDCWVPNEFPDITTPANARAEDRFRDNGEHLRSNMIQHSPIQWLRQAYDEAPDAEVFVWMGYSLLKQGVFTGKPITEDHVGKFLEKVENWTPDCIPLPGITARAPVNAHGDNWRFCGSTLIVPRRFLPQLERSYKANCRAFVLKYQCIPLDLAIWPAVEENSGLPVRWYKAEYDATQLTNFPG